MLHEVDLYKDNLPKRTADKCPQTSIPQKFVQTLLDFNNITPVNRCDVRGHVNLFTVLELFKQRYRPIRETIDFNNTFGKETLLNITFPTKKDICNMVLDGSHFAAFDFSAYYDQFEYKNGIGNYLCFRKGNKYYKTNRLCMGQRHACQIAQTTTLFLLDFPDRRCKTVYAYIDNVIFVGSEENVRHDSLIFIERCKKANLTLNEADLINKEGVDSCILQSGEWCGVHLDFVSKEAKIIDKTLTKLQLSWQRRKTWTYREFASHVGLIFWCWGILEIPVYKYYSLLKFISATSQLLQRDDSLWDKPCKIYDSAIPALEDWTNLCMSNSPRKIIPSSDPVWFVCTDASSWGWGYRAFSYATGEIRSYGQKWNLWQINRIFGQQANNDLMKRSVYAEPLAVYMSLCHLLKNGDQDNSEIRIAKACDDIGFDGTDMRMKIEVATDNSSAQHTINRGFASRSFEINRAIAELKMGFPNAKFDIELSFVPGHLNPADAPSRGLLSSSPPPYSFNNNNNSNTYTSAEIGNNHQYDCDNLRRLAELRAGLKPGTMNLPASVHARKVTD